MGNIQPLPNSSSSDRRTSKHQRYPSDIEEITHFGTFERDLDSVYDNSSTFDQFQRYTEVDKSLISNNRLSSNKSNELEQKTILEDEKTTDDNNIQNNNTPDIFKTTHTLAKEAGVYSEFDHSSKYSASKDNFLANQETSINHKLSSAIRWPIENPQRHRHNRHGHPNYQNIKGNIPKKVQLVTSVDNWTKRIELTRSHDDFVGILDFPEGTHKYRFIVDGEWKYNPDDNTVKDPNTDEICNVITIEKSDFDIFHALENDDSENLNTSSSKRTSQNEPNFEYEDPIRNLTNSINSEEYTQIIPDKHVLRAAGKDKKLSTALLPPHLLQKILLNEQVHQSYEPSLLTEPHHTMLNHLYALAIRNKVMALSATGRYKRKFVTTLLYKPL